MGNNIFQSNQDFTRKEFNIYSQNNVKTIECMQNTNEADIQNIQIIDNPKWNLLNSKFLSSNRYCPNDLETISLRTYDQLQSRRSYFFKIQSILLDGQFDMIPNIQTHKTVVQGDKNKQNQKNQQKINVNEKNYKKSKKLLSTKKQIQNKNCYNNLEINIQSFISLKKLNVQNYYKFIQKIGQGTFGNVYKVLCLRTNQFRAIKMLKKQKLYKKGIQKNKDKLKLTEIQVLSKIDHPNILKLYQVYFCNENYYLVTEFCGGGSIFSYLKYHESYSQSIVKKIMKQLLNALSYLHQKRIAHRDIKIQNIAFVKQITNSTNQNQTQIKILDLGQALFLKLKHNNKDKKQIGTIAYMAPQVIDGCYSELSDIWSCGVLLYMLMTGVAPFYKSTKEQTFYEIKKKQINFEQSQTQHISKQVKILINKMLNRDPFKRITAKQALKSNWFSETNQNTSLQPQKMKTVVQRLKNYHQANNFVSLVQHYLIFLKLSQQQRSQMGKIFRQIDKDNSGTIDVNQLKIAFQQSFGENLNHYQNFQQILQKIDKNKNKKIDLNQFITAFYNLKRDFYQKQLSIAFDYFDIDGNGFIDKNQFKKVLKGCQKNEIQHILKDIDKNQDQVITKDQFINYIKKQSFMDKQDEDKL